MRHFILLFLTAGVISCQSHHQTAKEPSDADIEQAIKDMYAHMSSADGGGSYHISNIEILEKKPGKDADHFLVKIKASGTFKNPPLANPKPDEDYAETRDEEIVFKQGKWMWHDPSE